VSERIGVALDDEATRAAVHAYTRNSAVALAAGIFTFVACEIFITLVDTQAKPLIVEDLAVVWFTLSLFAVWCGLSGTWKCARARRLLHRTSFMETPATYRIAWRRSSWNGQPVLVLHGGPDAGGDEILSIGATAQRYKRLPEMEYGSLLVARARHGWTVVAPLDRSTVVIAKRPRVPGHRAFLRYALDTVQPASSLGEVYR
jgi:hypothetical protein